MYIEWWVELTKPTTSFTLSGKYYYNYYRPLRHTIRRRATIGVALFGQNGYWD